MERNPVKSSNISTVGYDKESKELEVEFTSGGVYSFKDVPKEKYEEMIKAPSAGRYFLAEIKGRYHHTRLS